MPCPFDPSLLVNVPLGMFHCPICGCMIVAGMEHGPCIDEECKYYDAKAAKIVDNMESMRED